MLGFDSAGGTVGQGPASAHAASTSAIAERASKVVSFFDFPGHQRVGTDPDRNL
jgi:hypothetical protein